MNRSTVLLFVGLILVGDAFIPQVSLNTRILGSAAAAPRRRPRHCSRCLRMGQGADEIMAIIHRKQQQVKQLLNEHSDASDPLRMLMGYGSAKGQYTFRQTLRRNKDQNSNHQIAVIADIKRRSPTAPPHELASFNDIMPVCKQYKGHGCDALMINTDAGYNGSILDLELAARAAEGLPIIAKDFIIHPMQLAQAVHTGATCTVLIASVLGPALEDMLDLATMMGTEVIVEVHTPAECAKALEYGGGVIMVNQWDRVTGKLHRDQAYGIKNMIPNEVSCIALQSTLQRCA
jgi:indole-3-glycerol phosphate synthase